jgi:polar amino acid transport system substrate-binding protein
MIGIGEWKTRRLGLAAAAIAGSLLLGFTPAQAEPLKVAADVGYAPWAMRGPDGQATGFVIDVANDIARRMGRDKAEIIDVNFSAIFAGLFAGRYDAIMAPMEITDVRAKQLLFTEGYMSSGLALVIRSDDKEIKSPEDLKGKVLATNSGSQSDTWATENEAKYGYTVQRYDKDTDAMQAVVAGRAAANIVNVNVAQYAAVKNKKIVVAHRLYTNRDIGYAVRKGDEKLRAEIENALECMKMDGTIQGIHEKWFGEAPEPVNSMMKVFVGYGPVGYEGYEPTYHVPACK